jgi:hypothetical protein
MHMDGVIFSVARVCQREIWGSGSRVGREEKPAGVTRNSITHPWTMEPIEHEFASHHRIDNLSARTVST